MLLFAALQIQLPACGLALCWGMSVGGNSGLEEKFPCLLVCDEGPEPSIVPKGPGASSLSLKIIFPERAAGKCPLRVEGG